MCNVFHLPAYNVQLALYVYAQLAELLSSLSMIWV